MMKDFEESVAVWKPQTNEEVMSSVKIEHEKWKSSNCWRNSPPPIFGAQ